jgi:TldD protein
LEKGLFFLVAPPYAPFQQAGVAMSFSRRDFLKSTALISAGATFTDWSLVADNSDLAEISIALAKKLGASYADIRINRYREESIVTREERVLNVGQSQSFGFGVRVLLNGAWGFSASISSLLKLSGVSHDRRSKLRKRTLFTSRIRSNSFPRRRSLPVGRAPSKKILSKFQSIRKSPFSSSSTSSPSNPKGVSFINSSLSLQHEQKFYASTDGSRIEQQIIRTYPSFTVTAVNRAAGDFQTRSSLPSAKCIGYEYVEDYPWEKEASQAGEEAVQKLSAKPVEPGKYDLVIDPSNLWLTIHESVGHSTELDRALLWEADFAGTSFLTPDKIGKLQFGSRICNFFADRNQAHGLATVGYDDEGVAGQRWDLVKDGVFVGWQTTRDLAPLVGDSQSHGCLHADNWASVPFPRMPNVSLAPSRDEVSLDQLIADIDNGILIYGNGSWSIDQQRYNFQFGGQTFREIKKGKIGAMLRDAAYQSRTPDFWNACDGMGGKSTYQLHGAMNDGKGQPQQVNAVSHGCPVARFRQVNILNTAAKKA